ncbi:MAG: hypothetical protein KKA42_09070, partial [candidate division Zixibacteria bacterium]|nr:hypothetical protein [candidate division Zixibacteria bacterium]
MIVRDGTYSGTGNREVDLDDHNVTIRSENGSAATAINAGGLRGLLTGIGNDSGTVIDGFTITGADIGLHLKGSPRIRNTVVENCDYGLVTHGGALPHVSGTHFSTNTIAVDCEIGCAVTLASCTLTVQDIAVRTWNNASANLTDCRITGASLSALQAEGGVINWLGGTLADNNMALNGWSGVIVADSTEFISNDTALFGHCIVSNATVSGGLVGIARQFFHEMQVENVHFYDLDTMFAGLSPFARTTAAMHTASGVSMLSCTIRDCGSLGHLDGGTDGDEEGLSLTACSVIDNDAGLATARTTLTLTNCEITGNESPFITSISEYGRIHITGCTIANNTGNAWTLLVEPFNIWPEPLRVESSIIAFNSGVGINCVNPIDSPVIVLCTDAFGNAGGNYAGMTDPTGANGNISVDPNFCDTALGDFTLLYSSPCSPELNACSLQVGARDIACSYPEVSLPVVDTLGDSLHVINHRPLIHWQYADPLGQPQDSVELAVGLDSGVVDSVVWQSGPVATADWRLEYDGDSLLDGATYFLWLRVNNGYGWSNTVHTMYRMNSLPPVPTPLGPALDSFTGQFPVLWISVDTDAEGDSVTVDFRVESDSSFGPPQIVEAFDVAPELDSTGWSVSDALQENWRYFWQVRAFDGLEYSAWSTADSATFWVNQDAEAPSAPQCVTPLQSPDSILYDMMPAFVWSASLDPDPLDTVMYHLALDYLGDTLGPVRVDSLLDTMYTWP